MFVVELPDLPVSELIYVRKPIEVGCGLVISGYSAGDDVPPLLGLPGLAECLGFSRPGLGALLENQEGFGGRQLKGFGFSGQVLIVSARIGRAIKPVKAIALSDFHSILMYADLIAEKPRATGIALAFAEIGLMSVGGLPMSKDEMAALIDERVAEAVEGSNESH